MKKTKLVTSLALVLVLTCCMMATVFADTYYVQCNGTTASTITEGTHSYGNGQTCTITLRTAYCTRYRNGVSIYTKYHTHDHVRYHSISGCPGGTTIVCSHGSKH